ncbi:hypothetical protein [Bacteroides sp.]|nr:hypothetical protein [Bacteroides sp.]
MLIKPNPSLCPLWSLQNIAAIQTSNGHVKQDVMKSLLNLTPWTG